ncbi:MAG TPA: hypothetical protein VK797_23265 [Tepidisphaeraceae bacterium]|jgi:hypothetical protein|nr:hypothetical protein [Tepidisphaeraceae bacterium]
MKIGIDLDINQNGTIAATFNDVTRNFTGWYTGSGYDANGYPTQNGMQCQCLMIGCPAGTYTVQFDGTAMLTNWGRPLADIVKNGATTTAQLVLTASQQVNLTVSGLNPADPFRNFHIYQPGMSGTSPVFSSAFVQWLKPFGVYRSIDWAGVNIAKGSLSDPTQTPPANVMAPLLWANRRQLSAWDQTTQPKDQSQARGIAWELFLALSAQTGVAPWITVPYMADDNYVCQLAAMVKATLPASIVPIIELSNEVWNNSFGQWQQNYNAANSPPNMSVDGDISSGAVVPYPGGQPGTNSNTRANRLYAEKARHLGNLFRGILGAHNVKVVLAGQHMNPQVALDGLQWIAAKFGDVSSSFDYLAVAPYFPLNQPQQNPAPPAPPPTLQSIYQAALTDLATNCGPFIAAHKSLANQYNLALVGYEGGQSYNTWSNPPGGAGDLPTQLQTDPLMGQLYTAWLKTCETNGMALQMHCSFMRPWIANGLFALQQLPTDPPGQKWSALNSYPQSAVAAPGTPTVLTPGMYQVNK